MSGDGGGACDSAGFSAGEASVGGSGGGNGKNIGLGTTLFIHAFAQIGIGGYFHHDCPAQPYIPIYLEVLGAFTVVTGVLYVWHKNRPINHQLTTIFTLVHLFCLSVIVIGGVWIIFILPPNYNNDVKLHCNLTLYLFAIINTALFLGLLGLKILFNCYFIVRKFVCKVF